jgi:hypothetical protein
MPRTGEVIIPASDIPSYIHEFCKTKDLAARGAIAQLAMPTLAEAFLGYKALERENVELESLLQSERMGVNRIREELDPLWYDLFRDPKTGTCAPIPSRVNTINTIREMRLRLNTMYEQVGANLESKLQELVGHFMTAMVRTMRVDYAPPTGPDDNTPSWFVLIGGFVVAGFADEGEARRFHSNLHQNVVNAISNQGFESVSAIMAGRPQRYIDPYTCEIPEAAE